MPACSELIEAHAVDTYGEFVDANEELLRELPPPFSAASYYRSEVGTGIAADTCTHSLLDMDHNQQ